jgi:two-component system response regulator
MNSSVRVLLAEDDELCATLAMKVLCASAGLDKERVLIVGDGKETLDYLYRREAYAGYPPLQPALVLLDLKMPRVDGFDVLKQVKGDDAMRCIPIVVLSSSTQERDLRLAYDLGANGYIVKAMDFNEFRDTLDAVCKFWLNANEIPSACGGRTG